MIGGSGGLRVSVDSTAPWKLRTETLDENLPGGRKPTRLALAVDSPVTSARVTLTVRPD